MEIWVSASSLQGFIEFIEPVQILHLKRKEKKKKNTTHRTVKIVGT